MMDAPCKGCILSTPRRADAGTVPLLVLLHGDGGQSPLRLLEAWEPFTAPRGIALLAAACPRDLGCQGSWWQWDGDPAWLGEQVRAASAKVAIDPARVALLGWSGGASYLGRRLEGLGAPFSAVVFHGGGIPPRAGPCAARPLPTYFLVGDRNPLHHLAVRLGDDARQCRHDLTWDLVPGADHAGEWKAQTKHADAVLAWLALQRSDVAKAEMGEHDDTLPARDASPPPRAPLDAGPSPSPAPPTSRARAGCQATGGPNESGATGGLSSIAAIAAMAHAIRRWRRVAPRTTTHS